MKLGVSSYSYSNYMRQSGANYFDICDKAKKTGFEGIEFIDLNTDIHQAESETALAQAIRAYCEKIGLEVVAYTIHADFMQEGKDPQEEVERVKAKVDVAKVLGAKVLRHDGTWRTDRPWREAVRAIAGPIRQVTEYAAAQGIRTCTENHGMMLQDADRVEELIRLVDHPNYGWLVDMGNFLCGDDTPFHAVPIAAPYAFHVHVKDFLVKPWNADDPGSGWFRSRGGNFLRGTVAGHGVVPIRFCLETLRKAGYEGYVSYEFEGMEENLPAIEAAYRFIRSVIPE